jgi:hypothetical protein
MHCEFHSRKLFVSRGLGEVIVQPKAQSIKKGASGAM